MTLRRTPVYIERIHGAIADVTVAGVDLPPGSTAVYIGDLPEDAAPGKVFFAKANLDANSPEEVELCDIEWPWADMNVGTWADADAWPRAPKQRIEPILDLLRQAWYQHPEWRLGQLITNAVRYRPGRDLFYLEDDDVVRAGLRTLIDDDPRP